MRKGRNKRLMKRITAIVISIMMVIMPMEAMGTETLDTGVDIQHIRTEVTESGYQVSILASSAAGIKDYSFDGGETWQESYTTVMEQLPYEMVMARDNNLNTVGRFCPVINEIEKTPNGETNGNVILTIDTSDNNPSARVKEYSFDGGETWQESNTKTYSANEEGIEIWIRDFYGHVCTYTGEIENIDKVSPEIEYKETYKYGE